MGPEHMNNTFGPGATGNREHAFLRSAVESNMRAISVAAEQKFAVVGRARRSVDTGDGPSPVPAIVTVRDGELLDISRSFPTMADLCDVDAAASAALTCDGESIGGVEEWLELSQSTGREATAAGWMLSPIDLQVIKACGVTFVHSMLERLIEEQAHGDRAREQEFRFEIERAIGDALSSIAPGTESARVVEEALRNRGLWSQYLEVGIGPDVEVFTKSPVLSSVGYGAGVGLSPWSEWITTEPELALVCRSDGRVAGVTLGNDVTLRDWEGRSALLLGRAKDFIGSCALGPWTLLADSPDVPRLIEVVMAESVDVAILGTDGFDLSHSTQLSELSRPVDELVAQAAGPLHKYPDGFALFLGTVFAPTVDRDGDGLPFSHHAGDLVAIRHPLIGSLVNRFELATELTLAESGIRGLYASLSTRGLITPTTPELA